MYVLKTYLINVIKYMQLNILFLICLPGIVWRGECLPMLNYLCLPHLTRESGEWGVGQPGDPINLF